MRHVPRLPVVLVVVAAAAAAARPASAANATLTIPSSASIHGQAGAFFHTDLWAMNRSFANSVPVTASFRCFTGPCPASGAATFTLAPRESRLFADVVGTLFGAPETAGAIELRWDDTLGQLSATSRVYTPQLPAATFGTSIPAFRESGASSGAVFLGLGNNGGDLASGFRSNAGAYNPNPSPATVTFQLLSSSGAALGAPVALALGPNQAGQVNDVFGRAGLGSTVTTNATLRATASAPVFFDVTVIDNASGDSVFVRPESDAQVATSLPDTQSVPASASIHGQAGTFFHTDLWARNGSSLDPLVVSARLHCSTACGARGATFTLAPGETRLFPDVVATLFGSPESAGAIELNPTSGPGKLTATTRTYTPSLPAPTKGSAIPALALNEVRARALFLGLASNGGDLTGGFRTNVGVYNPLPFTATFTFSLFDGSGRLLGSTTSEIDGYGAVQINDIFGAVGAGGVATTNAYAVMTTQYLAFGYATVIDNKSGDSIFVTATDDERAP